MSTQCVTITITDNDITEPEETFSVTLVPVSDFVTLGDPPSSSVVIEDDGCESYWWSNVLLLYSILSTAVSVSMFVLDDEFDEEDGAGIVCVILSEGQLDGITATVALSTEAVTIFLLPSTADYTPLVSSELTFGPTASTGSTQCTSVSLVDDDIVEDTEQFSVEVSSTSDIVLIASPSFAVYSIADNVDSKLLSLITDKIVIPFVSYSLSTLQLLWCP